MSELFRVMVVLGIPLKNAVVDTLYPNPPVDVSDPPRRKCARCSAMLHNACPLLVGRMDTCKGRKRFIRTVIRGNDIADIDEWFNCQNRAGVTGKEQVDEKFTR